MSMLLLIFRNKMQLENERYILKFVITRLFTFLINKYVAVAQNTIFVIKRSLGLFWENICRYYGKLNGRAGDI